MVHKSRDTQNVFSLFGSVHTLKKSILDHLKSAPNLVSYQIALRKLWFCTLSHIQCWSTCEPQCECKLEPSWRTSSADLSSSVSTWTVCWPLCNKKQQHRCVLFILKQFLHYKASPPESSLFFNCNSYLWNIIKSCLCKLLNKNECRPICCYRIFFLGLKYQISIEV